MKKKILIPLDGSEFSQSILEAVMDLFKPSQYTLTLLRVTDIPAEAKVEELKKASDGWGVLIDWAYLVTPELSKTLEKRQAERLAHVEQELTADLIDDLGSAKQKLEYHGFEVQMLVRFGQAVDQIQACAAEYQVDLIAMATHGRTGLPEALMGSVAKKVLQDCPCPIMMLRPKAKRALETLAFKRTTPIMAGS